MIDPVRLVMATIITVLLANLVTALPTAASSPPSVHLPEEGGNVHACSPSSLQNSILTSSEISPRTYELNKKINSYTYVAGRRVLKYPLTPAREMTGLCPYAFSVPSSACTLDQRVAALRNNTLQSVRDAFGTPATPGLIDCMSLWAGAISAQEASTSTSARLLEATLRIFDNHNICDRYMDHVSELTSVSYSLNLDNTDKYAPEATYVAGMLASLCGDNQVAINLMTTSAAQHFGPALIELQELVSNARLRR